MADRPEVTAALDAVHEAHRAAAAAHIEHARAIADARRTLAGVLDADLPPAPFQFGSRLAAEDYAELREAGDRLGLDPDTYWTPEQMVTVLRALPLSLAAVLVGRWQEASTAAARCWESDHVAHIDRQRDQLLAVQQAHGCWNHTHLPVTVDG